MKTLFVVSPTVDAGLLDAMRTALAACEHGRFEIHAVKPEDSIPEIVTRHVRECGTEMVVAVGGDGTVSSAAHALIGGDVPLGIVPGGTGNLVARELGIPLDPAAAIALVSGTHNLRKIDAMKIAGRTYLLNAGVGVNAEVICETSRRGKSVFGRAAYVAAAVWKVIKAKSHRLEIAIDGVGRVYDAADVLVSNFGALARGLHPNCPAIAVDDGSVDVCVACMKDGIEYPWYYFQRSLFPRRAVRVVHELSASRSVEIRSEKPLSVQADGDIIGATPVTIEVLPRALAVAVPVRQ